MALLPFKTEAHLQDALLLFAEVTEPAPQLFVVDALFHQIERLLQRAVGDQVTEKAATFLAIDRSIEAAGGESLPEQGIQLIHGDVHRLGDFNATGHRAQLVG